MISDMGYVALLIALTAALPLAAGPFLKKTNQKKLAHYLTAIIFGGVTAAFACLVYCYVVSDFSVLNVALNSHTAKPLLYKITGAWGNHEGSMLLFAWILALYTFLFACLSNYRHATLALASQGAILSGVLLFIVMASNPFWRLFPVPEDGMDLNPLLQDIGLAVHPPILYLGYAGFSLAFAFAVAGLIAREVSRRWAESLRPWLLAAWAFLTAGIALGSWWAYRELGWGGFWFWDPVENSSLVPWLTAAALVHSLAVVRKREMLKRWTVLLCILVFAFSLMGFFLVRSGILTSVHAFAIDPARGFFILALLVLFIGGGLALFAARAGTLKEGKGFAFVSRESGLLLNNLFFATLAVTVLLGILYPILLEVFTGAHVSVGAPYYNLVCIPYALMALFLTVLITQVRWKQDRIKRVLRGQIMPFALTAVTGAIAVLAMDAARGFFIPVFILCAWVLIGTWWNALSQAAWRFHTLSRSTLGMAVAHSGLALFAVAAAYLAHFQSDTETLMKKDIPVEAGGYTIRLDALHNAMGDNYVAKRARFQVSKGSEAIAALYPEARFYPVRNITTSETAIHSALLGDLLIVIGEGTLEEGLAVRILARPGMNIVWLGCFLMLAGAVLAATDKRKKR